MFVDIGANLTDSQFKGVYRNKKIHESDLHEVLARAKQNGVCKIIITAGCLKDVEDALILCDEMDPEGNFLYTTVGVHPTLCHDLKENPDQYLKKLIKIAKQRPERIVAIGELGLDYDRTHFCDIETQERMFELQLKTLFPALQLPFFFHMRNAFIPFQRLIKENCDSTIRGVVHSFTGSVDEAKSILNMGLDIGLNGCSLRTRESLNFIKEIPINRLHFETDAPWCQIRPTHISYNFVKTHFPSVKCPEKFKPGSCIKCRNEPCNIIQVAEVVAHVLSTLNISFETLHKQIFLNSCSLFSLNANNKA